MQKRQSEDSDLIRLERNFILKVSWFMLIIILNSVYVHVHTHSVPVSVVRLKIISMEHVCYVIVVLHI